MTASRKTRVIVGLSGGVDSAVAALLLLRAGYEVEGLFMKNWEGDDDEDYCAAEEDYRVARDVSAQLEIPLHGVNFAREYWDRVFRHFLDEYGAGRTPNPDVLCNKEIKFKAFLDYALGLGAQFIATGHYARIERTPDRCRLLKGVDVNKDQSYFLYALGQRELRSALFPVGDLAKPLVRALAHEAGLPNHARKDSTGICFIGERKFKAFLQRYLPAQPGDIRSTDGAPLGRHEGLMYYTLGQRQGLGIGGPGEAWYVVDKDLRNNTLVVAQGEHHSALYHTALRAQELTWVAGDPPASPLRCRAKTRYRQSDQACTVHIEGSEALIVFDAPQRALTPGQSVVLYDAEVCLGGGIIAQAMRDAATTTPAGAAATLS
jgi:tRNA-specific 2-thiouridylase